MGLYWVHTVPPLMSRNAGFCDCFFKSSKSIIIFGCMSDLMLGGSQHCLLQTLLTISHIQLLGLFHHHSEHLVIVVLIIDVFACDLHAACVVSSLYYRGCQLWVWLLQVLCPVWLWWYPELWHHTHRSGAPRPYQVPPAGVYGNQRIPQVSTTVSRLWLCFHYQNFRVI